MDAKRDLKLSRFSLKRVKNCPPLQAKCFRLNPGRSVSINVNKTRKHFPETFMARPCFPMFLSFQHGKYCFQCQFLFSRCKLCLPYTTGNFNENPSMRALAKLLRARASEHSSNFCEQFEQRPNFANTFKLDGTIQYP